MTSHNIRRATHGLPIIALAVLIIASSFAFGAAGSDQRFGDCPDDHECSMSTDLVPNAVTGHTVYSSMKIRATASAADDALPVRFPADLVTRDPAGGPGQRVPTALGDGVSLVQSECVAWSNGKNLDVRPPVTENLGGSKRSSFFSDEDEDRHTPDAGTGPFGDDASQDYDPGRYLDSCVPAPLGEDPEVRGKARPTDFAGIMGYFSLETDSVSYGAYAVVVERGDCDPAAGRDFRFRAHLDFVDPNSIYHEVQEYDYTCGDLEGGGPAGNDIPTIPQVAGVSVSDQVKALFPLTGTDPRNEHGCQTWHTPDENARYFDLGHKCNGSIQDLFTERLWISPVHEPVWDDTLHAFYTFALAVDTCSGHQVDEGWDVVLTPHDWDALDYLLDGLRHSQPLVEVCHDGSSFSFDDTPRGRTTHDGPPASEYETMLGNPYDFNATSTTFGKHRQNCRSNFTDWTYNDHPGKNDAQLLGEIPGSFERRNYISDDCYPEDHKTAPIDIYVFGADPTGLFLTNSNGLTGLNAYVEDEATGPNHMP